MSPLPILTTSELQCPAGRLTNSPCVWFLQKCDVPQQSFQREIIILMDINGFNFGVPNSG
jgi:hypothetical protein